MTGLDFLGMHHGQPVFEAMPHSPFDDNVFATSDGELVYRSHHGCLSLPYVLLHLIPVSMTQPAAEQAAQSQEEPPREMEDFEIADDPFSLLAGC